uniref:Predicted protein n=1 Tax=Hordeum vulgare subsp. vulgare TaxID=112509 RepID=F2DYT9_HORVV|nr:predicted protein [Hordeum vulgare subsp. vulgare]
MALHGHGGRRGRLAAAAVWLVVVTTASVASARFVVEKNSIKVLSPHSLRGRHEAAIANYGVPDYGGTLTGVVLYPADTSLATGCKPFGATAFKSRSGRPVVLLVDRGGCYFALKTWNAQQAGAAAVLVADSVDEPLLTMDTPEEETPDMAFLANITAPSALVSKPFGDALRAAASDPKSGEVVVRLDWRESMPNPDARVEYEFWTNSNDECGPRCDEQAAFVAAFRGHAQLLEKAGDALFTPHYITWFCPAEYRGTRQCASQCINRGRYCAPDPEGGPRRRLPGPRRGAGEPPAAVRAPGGQRPERVVGVVGLRGRLPRPVLHAGEEVLPRVRRGGGGVARPAVGAGRAVHGRPRRRRRQRRAQDGAGRAGRAGQPRRRHHPAHARHQQRAVPGEAGEHGRPQGHLRRFQGDHGAPRVHDTRYGDGRVPAQQRRLLARRQDQHHRLQGHVQGEGVRVPGGGRRAVRGGRVQGVQAGRPRPVRRQQRRVLEGDEARQDLLRLQGLRVAQRLRVPAGLQGRRPHLPRRGRVQRQGGVHLPGLLLQEHLGRLPLRLRRRRRQPGVRHGRGHLRGEERGGHGVAGDGAGALVPRRRRARRLRLLQVQAQAVHGLGSGGDHVAVHASGGSEHRRREPAAQGGGRRGSIDGQTALGFQDGFPTNGE